MAKKKKRLKTVDIKNKKTKTLNPFSHLDSPKTKHNECFSLWTVRETKTVEALVFGLSKRSKQWIF